MSKPGIVTLTSVVLLSQLESGIAADTNQWAELESRVVERGLSLDEVLIPGRLTPEMQAWVHSKVPGDATEAETIRALLFALIEPFELRLTYDASHTGTAAEVWETRKANCLGFTHLFVGLSRELGLRTYYVRWARVQNFRKEGDLVVVSEHVSAGFGTGPQRQVLEFGAVEGLERKLSYPISDLEALARHYANLSAEALQSGDLQSAQSLARIATQLEPTLPEGWVNLGVSRRRSGDLAGAESAYMSASAADPDHLPAYLNLSALMQIEGREDVANEILGLLDRRDNRNPYVYLALGDASYYEARLSEADRYYRRATKLGPDLAEPRAARGLVALKFGNPKAARRWLKRAQARNPEDHRVKELVTKLSQQLDASG